LVTLLVSPDAGKNLSQPRTILQGLHADEGESSRSWDVYVHEWTIPQRCRVDSPMWISDQTQQQDEDLNYGI
nr:hypothetical protein [Tanacetum cinerariifolium]